MVEKTMSRLLLENNSLGFWLQCQILENTCVPMIGKNILRSSVEKKFFFSDGGAVFGPSDVWVPAHSLLTASFCQRFLTSLSLPNQVKFTLIHFGWGQESVDLYKRLDLDSGSGYGCLFTSSRWWWCWGWRRAGHLGVGDPEVSALDCHLVSPPPPPLHQALLVQK